MLLGPVFFRAQGAKSPSLFGVDDRTSMPGASLLEAFHNAELLALVRPRLLLGNACPPSRMRVVVLVHNRTEAKPTGHAVLV